MKRYYPKYPYARTGNLSSFERLVESHFERREKEYFQVIDMKSDYCDAKFVLNNTGIMGAMDHIVEIGANKMRLKQESTFFAGLWQYDLSEKEKAEKAALGSDPRQSSLSILEIADENCDEVIITDPKVTAESMRAIIAISFDQLHRVSLDRTNVSSMYYAALKYDVTILMEACKEMIRQLHSSFNDSWRREREPIKWEDFFFVISDLFRMGMTKEAMDLVIRALDDAKKLRNELVRAIKVESVMKLPFAMFILVVTNLNINDTNRIKNEEFYTRCLEWCKAENRRQQQMYDDEDSESDDDGGETAIAASSAAAAAVASAGAGKVTSEMPDGLDDDSKRGEVDEEEPVESVQRLMMKFIPYISFEDMKVGFLLDEVQQHGMVDQEIIAAAISIAASRPQQLDEEENLIDKRGSDARAPLKWTDLYDSDESVDAYWDDF